MKKFLLLMLMFCLAFAMSMTACGGDDEGSDGDTGTDGDTGDNPFDDYDCDDTSDACAQMACAYKSAYDSCVESGVDCSYYVDCIEDYMECVCPGGTLDATGGQTCATTYQTCITNAITG